MDQSSEDVRVVVLPSTFKALFIAPCACCDGGQFDADDAIDQVRLGCYGVDAVEQHGAFAAGHMLSAIGVKLPCSVTASRAQNAEGVLLLGAQTR